MKRCMNNAKCVIKNENGTTENICECLPGYEGELCQKGQFTTIFFGLIFQIWYIYIVKYVF